MNFAIFSENADRVELCLFDPAGDRELERVALPEHTNDIWHGYLPGVAPYQPSARVRSELSLILWQK